MRVETNYIVELQQAKGSKAKQEVLQKYASNRQFQLLLYYALNPLLTYHLSVRTLFKTKEDEVCFANTGLMFFQDIFECCDYLSRLRGIDDATVRQVKLLLYNHCDESERDIYIKLLSKTLRLGVTAKTVNKIIPELIPEWEVQQAFPVDKYPLEDGTMFWLTQKLNGVRATFYNGKLISRTGIPYEGLDHIIKEINFAAMAGFVLDGELTLKNTEGLSDNEAFRKATGIINSDNVHKTGICYTIFDAIPVRDFESPEPKEVYATRRTILEELGKVISTSATDAVKVLPILYSGTDQSQIDVYLERMVQEDKEGLMINTNVPYRRTRHRGVLKVKRFYTMDLPIVRCEEGSGRLSNTLGAFVLNFKGNEVKVGSGFTDEQRDIFWNNKDSICGELCEVKYKEISYDKNTGFESLQFPVFVQLRTDKTEISYG